MAIASNILVAYDGSDLSKRALTTAMDIAKQDDTIQITVTHVINYTTTVGVSMANTKVVNDLTSAANELIESVEKQLAEIPNPTKTSIFTGMPAVMLTQYAEENQCDLIVMGSRGLNGLQEMFLGSVSHHIVQEAHCPVLIIK